MRTFKLNLNQEEMELIQFMFRNFDYEMFKDRNIEYLEEIESVTWYDDCYNNLEEKLDKYYDVTVNPHFE